MTPETLAELKNNETVQKRLAKFMAHFCFRNSKLEDLHNQISDDEMKDLMIDVVNRGYAFIWAIFASQGGSATTRAFEPTARSAYRQVARQFACLFRPPRRTRAASRCHYLPRARTAALRASPSQWRFIRSIFASR